MREAGDVAFSDVIRDDDKCTGIVEFQSEDDMTYAVKNLNDTKFRSHEGETAYVEVKEDVDNEYKDRESRGFQMRGGFNPSRRGGYDRYRDDRYDDRRYARRSRSRSRSPYGGGR